MWPTLTVDNAICLRPGNVKKLGYFYLRDTLRSKLSNFQDNFIGKCGVGIFRPVLWVSAVSYFIASVFRSGSPFQIYQLAVKRISIKVAALMAWRRLADKNQQNKAMNITVNLFFIAVQGNVWIPLAAGFKNCLWSIFKRSPIPTLFFPIRPYTALIGNIISREARNRFKNLWGCGKILVSHGVALLHRVASGSEPYSCDNRGAACFLYNRII